jgi:hypothetical protein
MRSIVFGRSPQNKHSSRKKERTCKVPMYLTTKDIAVVYVMKKTNIITVCFLEEEDQQ